MDFDGIFKTLGYTLVGAAVLMVAGAYAGARIAGPIGAPIGAVAAPVVIGGGLFFVGWVLDSIEERQYKKGKK